ncbi:MAG: carbonic anhydrase [Nitrospirae bacterium]|nr:carbonic anhydrase [Nitrospirota bacterium]
MKERSGDPIPVRGRDDVLTDYRDTPVGDLLRHHNLCLHPKYSDRPRLFIAACMDYRISLRVPDRFAFFMRVPGANLRGHEFGLSSAVALFGIRAVCLIGHDDCAMENVSASREAFVSGLVKNGGWNEEEAARQFNRFRALNQTGGVTVFLRSETARLQALYPKVFFAALLYRVREDRLYQIPPESHKASA